MGNRGLKYWLIAPILAGGLCAAGSSAAEENAQPKAFNSEVAFGVYAVIGEQPLLSCGRMAPQTRASLGPRFHSRVGGTMWRWPASKS